MLPLASKLSGLIVPTSLRHISFSKFCNFHIEMASIPALEILNEIFSVADAMRKILIIGNSGSGKSWLGKRLATVCNVPYVALDRLFWEPGGYNVKRCKTLVAQDLTQLQGTDTWLIEGVFGQMAEDMLPYADTLFFLDLPWEECRSNLLARGSESARQRDPAVRNKAFRNCLPGRLRTIRVKTRTPARFTELFSSSSPAQTTRHLAAGDVAYY